MSNRIVAATVAALLSLTSTAVFAAEPTPAGAYYGAGTVGAMFVETAGLAVSGGDVARQGGSATAGTVRWTGGPVANSEGAYYGAGAIGAMFRESAGLATNGGDVGRQGGGATASAVRWEVAAPALQPGT
jgi:hypothetical protein